MTRLTCRRCRGTGTIPNDVLEMCRTMESPGARRSFPIEPDDVTDGVNERSDGCTVHEVTVPCPRCDGNGSLEFDEEG